MICTPNDGAECSPGGGTHGGMSYSCANPRVCDPDSCKCKCPPPAMAGSCQTDADCTPPQKCGDCKCGKCETRPWSQTIWCVAGSVRRSQLLNGTTCVFGTTCVKPSGANGNCTERYRRETVNCSWLNPVTRQWVYGSAYADVPTCVCQ